MDNTDWKGAAGEKKKENQLLERADALWRDQLKTHQPAAIDEDRRKALYAVMRKAEQNLMGKCKQIYCRS